METRITSQPELGENHYCIEHFERDENGTETPLHAPWIAYVNPAKETPEEHAARMLDLHQNPPAPDLSESVIERRKWRSVREKRDTLLAASDWTQFPDVPLSAEKKSMWQTYRQALRDLPQTTADPADVEWPEMPA